MSDEGVHKAYTYQLKPTPEQERMMAETVWRCRMLYNTALEQRITAYRRCGVSLTSLSAARRVARPESGIPGVWGNPLAGLARRVDASRQDVSSVLSPGASWAGAGLPALSGAHRYHSFTYKQYGNGARLDNGFLVLSKIGRVALRWSRPLEGAPKTVTISREADGWYVILSCADVPAQPLPATGKETGRETGLDVGLKVFLITAEGEAVENPRHYRRGEKKLAKAQRRVSRREKGSQRRRKAVGWRAKAHQAVQRQRRDFHHKTALALLRQYDTISLEDVRVANLVRNHHLAKSIADAGWASPAPSSKPRQHAPGVELWRFPRSTPARTAAAVGRACPRV